MFAKRLIAVIVPAYNEADKIEHTLRSIPGFVQHVIVVDDASHDATAALAASVKRPGLEVIVHDKNRGVGAALVTGYRRAFAIGAEITAVMAGDSQMDPEDLPALLSAVVAGADYAKGNRFSYGKSSKPLWREMPLSRLIGNVALSFGTKLSSGLWHIFDSQCGYTAANRRAVEVILAEPMFPRYGYPNDVLVRLSMADTSVVDVPVRPVYGPQWRSGIRPWRVVWPICMLLLRGGLRRQWRRISSASRRSSALISDQ
jgi:glycosyltransferase involved in cell wall biosynthesis